MARLARCFHAAVVLAALLAPGAAFAQSREPFTTSAPRRRSRHARVRFNLQEVDLDEAVRAIGAITGRRFVYSASLRAVRVTVFAPTPVTVAEAYEAFVAALQASGLAVVPAGAFLRVVPLEGVPREPVPVTTSGAPRS